jgi:TRAP-type C4-dicarboxylate transport system permease small subunit
MNEPGLSSGSGQHARDFESVRAPGQGRRSALLPAGPPAPLPLRWLGIAVDCGIVVIGAAMITLVFMNVVLRVFSLDFAWVTELAELLMVWVTFLGGAAAARRGAHMTITEFVDKLSGRGRRIADGLIDAVAAVVLALLVIYGINLVRAGWGNELSVLQIPMSFQYLGMPVGCAAMLAFVLWDLAQILRGRDRAQRWPAD